VGGRRSTGAAACPDPVVVKVDTAAGGLGRIIEQGEAITHEVREGVGEARGTTNGGPGFAVEAVGEAGDLRRGLKFAFDPQNTVLPESGMEAISLGVVGVPGNGSVRLTWQATVRATTDKASWAATLNCRPKIGHSRSGSPRAHPGPSRRPNRPSRRGSARDPCCRRRLLRCDPRSRGQVL
jgi:hypothetical protein